MNDDHSDFIQSLMLDVQWALDQLAISDTPPARRNLIRTLVSATEGLSWAYRVHILSVAKHLDAATPLMEMALMEATYFVSEKGELVEQARYISMTAMIRLTTKIAQTFCDTVEVDFGSSGWADLKSTIAVRNRITHPKGVDDLRISDAELHKAQEGFFWYSNSAVTVMEQVVKAFGEHTKMAKDLLARLAAGDPDAIALYERAHREIDD